MMIVAVDNPVMFIGFKLGRNCIAWRHLYTVPGLQRRGDKPQSTWRHGRRSKQPPTQWDNQL